MSQTKSTANIGPGCGCLFIFILAFVATLGVHAANWLVSLF